jgi:glycosyltransferase involved in cell wall biosynthesis
VRELADGLLRRGQRPSLITSHPGPPSRTIEDGLAVLRLPRPPQGRLLRRHYEPYLSHVPLSYAALRLGDYDVSHATYPTDALAAVRWKQRTGRPAVLSYLGIPDRPGLREYRRRLENLQRATRECDAVIALSQYSADAFRDWLGYEARVIEPGVDLDAFRADRERTEEPTIVCSAAADVPRKHVGLLVRALDLVRRERPGCRLILSRPRDLAPVEAAGVDARAPGVQWVDLDDRDVLAGWNASAWVSALPAQNEAFGLVLLEALACGTPVVGYADAAIPELIDSPEIGRLFDRLEPDALAAALLETLELAEQPETRSRCRARAEELSSQRCADRYLALYEELL